MNDTPTPATLAHQAFVAARAPAWLSGAPPELRRHLHRLTLEAEAARHRLKDAAASLPQLEAFALDRLRTLLAPLPGQPIDPTQAVLYWTDPAGKRPPLQRSLLEAALLNFHERETLPSAYGKGSGLFAQVTADGQANPLKPLSLAPWVFARQCRGLDIGGGFQHLLEERIPSALPSRTHFVSATVPLSWRVYEAKRRAFQAAACIATIQGRLGLEGLALLDAWKLAPWHEPAGSAAVTAGANRLELFGIPLARVLVFRATTDDHQAQPVVAYIPGDPSGSVEQFPSAQALAIVLGERLRQRRYLQFFAGFVPLARRLEFITQVNQALAPHSWLPPHLSWTPITLSGDPFVQGYRIWAQQTLAEAVQAAVPTATMDQRDSHERYAHWVELGERLGVTLAMLVGSGLPGVNVLVDAIVLGQALYSVYEGVQAWRHGDTKGAVDHLFGAIENTAFLGLGKRPEPTTDALEFADGLQPVTSADGQVRLWRPDLNDFRAHDLPPASVRPDEAGVYHHRGRAWIRVEGRFHEVTRAPGSGHAQLLPRPEGGYAPALHGDGAGAWRAAHEQPGQWQSLRLIQRFDHRYEALPGDLLLEAQRLAGVSDGQLRSAHLDGSGAPPLLKHLLEWRLVARGLDAALDTLASRRRLDRPAPGLVQTLRNLPGWPSERALEYHSEEGRQRFGPVADSRPLQLDAAALEDGSWPARLISQLDSVSLDALLGEDASRVPAEFDYQRFAEHWAAYLQAHREALIDQLSAKDMPTDPARQTLARQFPGLLAESIEALMRDRTQGERNALANGRMPPAVAELAAEQLRQQRIVRACDALAQGRFNVDRERLVFGLWPRLGGWAQAMRVELRQGDVQGPVLQQAGSATAPRWLIVRRGERYQAFDDQGLELSQQTSLELAIAATVPDPLRPAFVAEAGGPDGLRDTLTRLALDDRQALRPLLGMAADNRRFFRPPVRQASGAVGYALSGRGRALETPLGAVEPYRAALRALYPEVSEAEMTELRARLGQGEAATTALAALNAELARLRLELDTWVGRAAQDVAENAADEVLNRRSVARNIVRVWQRRESTLARGGLGYGLDLGGRVVSELPTLSVRLPHVQRLSLVDMRLARVNDGFLAGFPNITFLDLSFNDVAELPAGIAQLTRLERLRADFTELNTVQQVVDAVLPLAGTLESLGLAGNGINLSPNDFQRLGQLPRLRYLSLEENAITLTEDTVGGFNQLTQIEELSLSQNPLERPPRVDALVNLVWLELNDTRIEQFPPGLVNLMNLNPLALMEVDLSANQIVEVPDLTETRFVRLAREAAGDVESPHYGMVLNLDGNPLTEASQQMLRRASIEYFPEAHQGDIIAYDPDQWLTDCPSALADLIRAERDNTHEAAEFYHVLGRVVDTADYRSDPGRTLRRAWDLVDTWLRPGQEVPPGLNALRERLFSLAEDTRGTCGDGIALTLDEMEFEVQAWRIVARSQAIDDGPLHDLLTFQRSLWRRALVDDFARRIVRARVARRNGLEDAQTAPALDPLDDIEDNVLDQGLDEVEVRFHLLQKLEGPLGLPPARGMRYTTRVSGATAQRVGAAVLQADTDLAFARWAAERPSFRRYLENARVGDFEPVREQWQEAANYLFSATTQDNGGLSPLPGALEGLREALPDARWQGPGLPPLNEQQLRLAYDWTSRQREQALDALALRLTRRLLGLDPETR